MRAAALVLAALIAVQAATPARAQAPAPGRERPVYFKADALRYDRELGVMVASGHVEFTREDTTLLAETVSYNEKEDLVTASGQVTLLQPTGEVIFADYVELSGDLKDGVMTNLRIRLQDDSRIAANSAKRSGGNRNEMSKAVYSPCDLCPDKPNRAPLWQIKANRVIHDEQSHDIIYNDAVLEMYGVPVAFLPYLSHPDPTVNRRSGFLSPSFGSDSQLGRIVRVPYYFDIAPNSDATVEPIVTTNEGPALAGEYRHRFRHGLTSVAGSITQASAGDDRDRARGHVKGLARFDLNPTWRAGMDLYRATDDTYLRRYKIDSAESLTSQAFVEGFRGRNYAGARAYSFQGLRIDDDPGLTPLVWPIAEYSLVGDPGRLGQYWSFNANLMQLTRSEGTDSRRLSVTPGLRLPITTSTGEVYTLFATMQTDVYYASDLVDPHYAGPHDGWAGRVFPQVGIDWRYPFIRRDGTSSQIIEPIVGFVAGPNGGNSFKIPNEDSGDFELQDSNIFDANRFTGLDRVEGGQRVYYGLRASAIGLMKGGSTTIFLGQSYRFNDDDSFPKQSGLEDNFSDIVGRVKITPSEYVNAVYRFRVDKDNLEARRHEVGATVGPRALKVGVNYIFIDSRPDQPEFPLPREQIQGLVNTQLTPHWALGGGFLRDLAAPQGGAKELRHGIILAYEDECFLFTSDLARSFTVDRDVRPSTTLMFRLTFKTLGRVQFSGL
jgi:LPS-assembly protein